MKIEQPKRKFVCSICGVDLTKTPDYTYDEKLDLLICPKKKCNDEYLKLKMIKFKRSQKKKREVR